MRLNNRVCIVVVVLLCMVEVCAVDTYITAVQTGVYTVSTESEQVIEKPIPGKHGDWKIKITKRKGGEYDEQKDTIEIWFTPKKDSKGCKNICTVQTVKIVAYDAEGNKITSHSDEFYVDKMFNFHSHTVDDQVHDGEDYVVIDHIECEGDPFHNGFDKLHDKNPRGDATSTPVKAAYFYDKPGFPIGTVSKKKTIKKFILTFETCVICVDTGEILGSIRWQAVSIPGDRGEITLLSEREGEPSETFKKALKKFMENHSREKMVNGKKVLHWYCPEIRNWLAGPRGIFGDPWGDPIPEGFIKKWIKTEEPRGTRCDRLVLGGLTTEWSNLVYEVTGTTEGESLVIDESTVGGGEYYGSAQEALDAGMDMVERAAIKFTWSGDQTKMVKGIILTSNKDISSEDVSPFIEVSARFSNDFEILDVYVLPTELMHHLLELMSAYERPLTNSDGCVTVSLLAGTGTEEAAAFTGALNPEHVGSFITEAASHTKVTQEILEIFNYIGLNFGKIAIAQYVPPVEFFVNQEGHPCVIIVVGSEAATMDADSAALLAAKVEKMAVADAGPVLVVEDIDFDFDDWKLNGGYNVILVGGPVANTLVDSLVGEGFSQVAWKTSKGEGEYLVDVYGNGFHILIIAGADRDTTQSAVMALIQWI